MKQIRYGIFETNSSSTHCLILCTKEEWNDFQEGKLLLEEDIDLRNLISIVNSEQFEFTNREVNSAYNLAEPWLKNSSLTKEKLIKGSRIKVNNNRTKFRWWCEIDEDSLKKWFFSELSDLHTFLCKDEYN